MTATVIDLAAARAERGERLRARTRCPSAFRVGDRVRIDRPGDGHHGCVVQVVGVVPELATGRTRYIVAAGGVRRCVGADRLAPAPREAER